MKNKIIEELFENILLTIDIILTNKFYQKKETMPQVKLKIQQWYCEFQKKDSLTTIKVDELQFLDSEINDIFDLYMITESANENYTERLSYYFSMLKKFWKNDILGGEENVK